MQERARMWFNRSDAHFAIEEAPVDVGGEQGRITAAYFDQALRLPVAQERKQRARIGLAELGVLQPVSVIVVVRARRVIDSGQLCRDYFPQQQRLRCWPEIASRTYRITGPQTPALHGARIDAAARRLDAPASFPHPPLPPPHHRTVRPP